MGVILTVEEVNGTHKDHLGLYDMKDISGRVDCGDLDHEVTPAVENHNTTNILFSILHMRGRRKTHLLGQLLLGAIHKLAMSPTPENLNLDPYAGKTIVLNTGQHMPSVGLGTFQDPDDQEESVLTALNCGYRHIDTAHNYGTEKQVGHGIKRSGVPRHEIFLTTKLWCNAHHPDDVESSLDKSLRDLGTDYVDLYLMHYPCAFKRGSDLFPTGADGKMLTGPTHFMETWRAMEKLIKTGKTRAIGVSNFSKIELEQILQEGTIVPAVHQMELHPYLQQKDFVKWHEENGIRIIQFSPSGNLNNFYREVSWAKEVAQMTRLIDHPTLLQIANNHGKSSIQVALAWGIQSGRSVIPKSTIEWQILENRVAEKIMLDESDLAAISSMDQKARFNDPSDLFGYDLYVGLDGKEA